MTRRFVAFPRFLCSIHTSRLAPRMRPRTTRARLGVGEKVIPSRRPLNRIRLNSRCVHSLRPTASTLQELAYRDEASDYGECDEAVHRVFDDVRVQVIE